MTCNQNLHSKNKNACLLSQKPENRNQAKKSFCLFFIQTVFIVFSSIVTAILFKHGKKQETTILSQKMRSLPGLINGMLVGFMGTLKGTKFLGFHFSMKKMGFLALWKRYQKDKELSIWFQQPWISINWGCIDKVVKLVDGTTFVVSLFGLKGRRTTTHVGFVFNFQ